MIDDLNTLGVPQEYPQETTEQPEPVEAPAQVKAAQPESNSVEKNARILRERAEQYERKAMDEERKRLELERYIQDMRHQQVPTSPADEEDDLGVEDDGYVEGKHVKKNNKILKAKVNSLEKQQAEANAKMAEQTAKMADQFAEWRLKAQYADFNSVVTPENIKKLAAVKPVLYKNMFANPDLYEKGESAYDLIKSYVATDDYNVQDEKIESNKTKPRSAASAPTQVAESPLSRASDYDRRVLSEERKEQLRQQVAQSKRFR